MPNRILIVDDEEPTRDILRAALEMNGYEVREAGCAIEVWKSIGDGWSPDVVLLDIVMPGRSGVDLIAQLKEQLPDAEVVLMTGYSSVEIVQRAIREGAHDFLSKPFGISEVWEAVEGALKKHEGTSVRSHHVSG